MKTLLEKFHASPLDEALIAQLLRAKGDDAELLRAAAYDCMKQHVGEAVYFRGLLEVSNICTLNCYYCGIRKDNDIPRYTIDEEDIVQAAKQCAAEGFGSMLLQSGEIPSDKYTDFICRALERIKRETKSALLPNGLGITLSLGVFSKAQYQRFFDVGAHRYLLRIETSNEELFSQIHPKEQTLEQRYTAIGHLQEVGFQTGTGVMSGLPGQTMEMLARDILMFKTLDIDMVGMGPFLPAANTPMSNADIMSAADRLQLGLNMIAVTRLVCKDINIASTTALEALHPEGRNRGLLSGGNVGMPNLTPMENRPNYKLYDNKPMAKGIDGAIKAVEKIGRYVALNEFGDPKHFWVRQK